MGYARPFEIDTSTPVEGAEPPRSDTNKLLGLELLRFASALAVLFFHYSHFADVLGAPALDRAAVPFYPIVWPLYDYGQYGVQIFWGISGYIFFWKYGAAIHSRNVAAHNFFWLRFSRLYPLHIVTLLAVVGLSAIHRQLAGFDFVFSANDAVWFVRQLFLATDWAEESPFTFNGPVWSISAEIAVYAAFFLLLRRFAPSTKLCVGVIIAGLAMQMAGVDWVSIGCATYFFAGGLASLASKEWQPKAGLALAILIAGCAGLGILGDRGKLPTILLLAVPCLLIAISHWPSLHRWQRPIQAAGNLTYSSYLVHFPLQLLLAIGVAASGIVLPLTNPLFLLAYLFVTFAVAAASYRLFELPAQNWIRRRTLQGRTAA